MARYIDADKLTDKLEELQFNAPVMTPVMKIYNVIELVEDQPTADVVEVVRCKDCKRCYEKRTKRGNQLMRFCMRMDGNEYQVNANDFCSYGTPKERGGEN